MSGIRLGREGPVATLTLDRPPLNILDLDALAELRERAAELEAMPDLALVLVRGAGERAFSAGVAVQDHTGDKIGAMLDRFHGALRILAGLPAVTAAIVDGACFGGGMELAAACDLVIAAEPSRFGQPEIKLGCFPPFAAALYPRLIGPKAAADLLLTGRTLSCAEAEGLGFVSRRVAEGDIEAAIDELREQIVSLSRPVLGLTKQALAAGSRDDFESALRETERIYLEELALHHDMEEGVRAFLDKRAPRWKHD